MFDGPHRQRTRVGDIVTRNDVTRNDFLRWGTCVFGVICWGLIGAPWPGFAGGSALQASEVQLAELSNDARVHLQQVDVLLANGQPVEALTKLRRVMSDSEHAVMEIQSAHASAGFRCFLPVRDACQLKLAAWHETAPEMLRMYRRQVDGVAKRWLAEALKSSDPTRLQDLVERYFCSSVGDEALFWLGEFAFQRGDYARARAAWERIHPSFRWSSQGTRFDRYTGLPSWLLLREVDVDAHWAQVSAAVSGQTTADRWLAYPDTDLDIAKIRARLVLTAIMQGRKQQAAIELDLLRRLSPEAEGRLGGGSGNYVQRLEEIVAASQAWPAEQRGGDWPTFAGDPRRHRQVARDVDVGGGPIWQLTLPRQAWVDSEGIASRLRIGEDAASLLSYHPIVADGLVCVGTDDPDVDLRAVDLQTGAVVFAGTRLPTPDSQYSGRLGRTVPRHAYSSRPGKLFARVQEHSGGAATDNQPRARRSRLVALDLKAEGKRMFDVQFEPPAWPGNWSFAGPPVCDDDYIYIVAQRLDAVRAESYLVCLDARDGSLQWKQFICAAQSLAGDRGEIPNNVLTLNQGILYFNSNAGVVAAVSAHNGATRWVARYPRAPNDATLASDVDPPYRFRDLNPCLVRDGMLYVAPADCSRLFALDAVTGQLIWTTPAEQGGDIMHLLGVGAGHLIGSGEGIYWFDAYNGQLKAQVSGGFHASPGFARQQPRGYGRGLLAGKNVYWPTRDAIFVFEQRIIKTETGWSSVLVREIDLASRHATGGNLVMSDGILLIASGDRLYAFNEFGKTSHAAN